MMNFRQKAILAACFTFCASGCAVNRPLSNEIVTKSMVLVPEKPMAPDPETANQRDVALYIVLLRGWGEAMAIQLRSVGKLLEDNEPKK